MFSSSSELIFRGCAEAMYEHDYGCDSDLQVSHKLILSSKESITILGDAGSGRDRPARRLPAGGRGHQHLLLQQPELQRGHLQRGQAACSHHMGRGAGNCDHDVLLTIPKYIFITTVQYK